MNRDVLAHRKRLCRNTGGRHGRSASIFGDIPRHDIDVNPESEPVYHLAGVLNALDECLLSEAQHEIDSWKA